MYQHLYTTAFTLQVQKGSSGDTIDIARAVRDHVAARADQMPEGLALGTKRWRRKGIKSHLCVSPGQKSVMSNTSC